VHGHTNTILVGASQPSVQGHTNTILVRANHPYTDIPTPFWLVRANHPYRTHQHHFGWCEPTYLRRHVQAVSPTSPSNQQWKTTQQSGF
jgi:hypothetical protein